MNINKNKLDSDNQDIEIVNLKLKEDHIQQLLHQKGFYKAYHMNKQKWISIILDDTLSDYEIIQHIDESYQLTNLFMNGLYRLILKTMIFFIVLIILIQSYGNNFHIYEKMIGFMSMSISLIIIFFTTVRS